jgi:hypothetical protein
MGETGASVLSPLPTMLLRLLLLPRLGSTENLFG